MRPTTNRERGKRYINSIYQVTDYLSLGSVGHSYEGKENNESKKSEGEKGAGRFTIASPEKEECVYVYDGRSRRGR
jgi:hypothetical protein